MQRVLRRGALLSVLVVTSCAKPITTTAKPDPDTPPAAPRSSQPATRPRLLVSVIIDQLGSDAWLRLAPLLADGGVFARAQREGTVYERLVYPYAATFTAPGHAAVYSGATPRQSGIASNYVVDHGRSGRRPIVDDGKHAVLGAHGKHAGPGALKVDTVADALKAATSGVGKVASLSLKARSAILPAGRRPDLVLWYEAAAGGFTTSTYYMNTLPNWLTEYQRTHPIDATQVVWRPFDAARLAAQLGPDAAPGEGAFAGLDTSFPHALAASSKPTTAWMLTPASSDTLLDLARASVRALELGGDDVPDLLALSISGTDFAGHVFGPDSWEYADHLRHVDRALERLLNELGQHTSVVMLVTSDHGAARLPEHAHTSEPPAARLDDTALVARLEAAAAAVAGEGDWVFGYGDGYVVLTPAARAHPEHAKIRQAILSELRNDPRVLIAHDTLQPLEGEMHGLAEAVANSLHPNASGDIFVVPRENVVPEIGLTPGAGTTHGSPWAYDTDVPLFLVGPGIPHQHIAERTDLRRIASTLALLLGVAAPLPEAPPPLVALRQ